MEGPRRSLAQTRFQNTFRIRKHVTNTFPDTWGAIRKQHVSENACARRQRPDTRILKPDAQTNTAEVLLDW